MKNHYGKNVDFLVEKKINNKKKNPSENKSELFPTLKKAKAYTCVICNRHMYQNGTKKVDQIKCKCSFDIDLKFNTDNKMYIW